MIRKVFDEEMLPQISEDQDGGFNPDETRCRHCNRTFYHSSNLRRHIKVVHQIDETIKQQIKEMLASSKLNENETPFVDEAELDCHVEYTNWIKTKETQYYEFHNQAMHETTHKLK